VAYAGSESVLLMGLSGPPVGAPFPVEPRHIPCWRPEPRRIVPHGREVKAGWLHHYGSKERGRVAVFGTERPGGPSAASWRWMATACASGCIRAVASDARFSLGPCAAPLPGNLHLGIGDFARRIVSGLQE
jgi:hypothetical protein